MPLSGKRKYDFYETYTSPTMPPNVAGPSGTYDASNYELEPIMPTPELQELYNKWQQQRAMHAHLQQDAEPTSGNVYNDGQNDLLRPPSPSATTTSRSPSCPSTSHSVTHEINKMRLGEDSSKPSGKKRKQGRQGPLEAQDKARTAFVRKLKACESCRKRKVKCDHYNFHLFDKAYRASASTATAPTPQVTVTNPDIQTQHHDLIGVGVNLNGISPQLPFQTGQEDAHSDFENLLRQTQTQQPLTSPNTSPLYNFSQSWQSSTNSNLAASTSSYPVLSPNSLDAPRTEPADCSHVPIGRCITPDDAEWNDAEEWECRFGDDGTASSHSNASDDIMIICKQRYGTISHLSEHYRVEHVPFENGKFYPRCKRCELHYDNEWWPRCPVCDDVVAFQDPEKWYFGDLLGTSSSRMSDRSIRVVAGKDWQPPSLTRNQTITQFNMTGYGAGALGSQPSPNIAYYPHSTGYGNTSCHYQSELGRNTKPAAPLPSSKIPPPVTPQKTRSEIINSNMCSTVVGTSSSGGGGGKSCPLYAMRKEFMSNTSNKRYSSSQPAAVSFRLVVAPSFVHSAVAHHPALLRLLVLFLVTFVVTNGWLLASSTAGRGRGRGRGMVPGGVMAANVGDIYVGFVLFGLVGMWLVKHVRLWVVDGDERRSRRQFYHRQQRCFMRDVVGIPQQSDLEGVVEFTPVLVAGDDGHGADQRDFYSRESAAAAG